MIVLGKGYIIPSEVWDNILTYEEGHGTLLAFNEWITEHSSLIHFTSGHANMKESCFIGKVLNAPYWTSPDYVRIGRAYEYEGKEYLTEEQYKEIAEVLHTVLTHPAVNGEIDESVMFPHLYALDIVD